MSIKNYSEYEKSHGQVPNKLVTGVIQLFRDDGDYAGLATTLNPHRLFTEGYQENPNDWTVAFPEEDEVVACPVQAESHRGNAVGCKIVPKGEIPAGWSNAAHADALCCQWPDGSGGWYVPEHDATSVLNWQLSATLAAKGVSFTPSDPIIAARWQFEPSFAIDGVVATALKASLGYDASQLQALFNEAAALK